MKTKAKKAYTIHTNMGKFHVKAKDERAARFQFYKLKLKLLKISKK